MQQKYLEHQEIVHYLIVIVLSIVSSTCQALPEEMYGTWEAMDTEGQYQLQSVLILNKNGSHLFAQEGVGRRNVFAFSDDDITEKDAYMEVNITRIVEGRFFLNALALSIWSFKLLLIPNTVTSTLHVSYIQHSKTAPITVVEQKSLLKSGQPVLNLSEDIKQYLKP